MTSKDNQPNNSQPLQSTSPIYPNPQTDSSALIPEYSLRAFIGLAGKVFREGLPSLVWIDAIVFDIKSKGKGFAVELLDPNSQDTSQGASLHAFIWRRGQDAIASAIGCAFNPNLLTGVEARLLIEPSFHPRFHLQGNIIGIDPELSESLLTKRLEQIRADLKRDGLYDRQKKTFKVAPADITRLVVIHPPESAGWADIAGALDRFEKRGILNVYSLTASFQGPNALPSLKSALNEAQRLVTTAAIDLVLIVRGGGAASGLAALSDPDLAQQVCLMKAPVVTGTGHAINRNILDEVAWHAAHTPSQALQVVIKILRRRAGDAINSHHQIINILDDRIEHTFRPRLEAQRQNCIQGLRASLERAEAGLAALHARISGARQSLPRELVLRQNQIAQIFMAAKRLIRQRFEAADADVTRLRTGTLTACRAHVDQHANSLTIASQSLKASAQDRYDAQAASIEALKVSIDRDVLRIFVEASNGLAIIRETIGTLSLEGTLKRGFVVALKEQTLLKTVAAASACPDFEILFQDGFLRVVPR
jgi:exodeoxyribonuclease VII large subunit